MDSPCHILCLVFLAIILECSRSIEGLCCQHLDYSRVIEGGGAWWHYCHEKYHYKENYQGWFCEDCTKTYCCSYGGCDILCCNCASVCRKQARPSEPGRERRSPGRNINSLYLPNT